MHLLGGVHITIAVCISVTVCIGSDTSDDDCSHYLSHIPTYQPATPILCENEMANKTEGCRPYDATCSEWCENEIEMDVVDSETGHILLDVPLAPASCCHDAYLIELVLYQCSDHSINLGRHTRFIVDLHRQQCSNPQSQQTSLKLHFYYVFSGCYRLEIQPMKNESTYHKCLPDIFQIETKYKKDFMGQVMIYPLYSYQSGTLEINASGGGVSLTQLMTLNILANNSRLSGVVIYKKWCSCEWEGVTLKCKFGGIPAGGNYCIEVKIQDTRCEEGSIWTSQSNTSCHWYTNYSVDEKEHVKEGEEYTVMPWWALGVVAGAVVAGVGVAVARRRALLAATHLPPAVYKPVPAQVSPSRLPPPSHLLLLYPRDCPELMEVMAIFRQTFALKSGVTILDMWDEDQWDEVISFGQGWLGSQLAREGLVVAVVATEAALLAEAAYLRGESPLYSPPHSLDPLFLAALSNLTHATSPYTSLFVLRLDGENYEQQKFQYLNPFTIFTIPQQFRSLINAVLNEPGSEIEMLTGGLEEGLEPLCSALETFNTFRRKTPDYLSQMISYAKPKLNLPSH